jgi:ribA/ribD-fused uncharacterized protein
VWPKIMGTDDPARQKRYGRTITGFRQDSWDQHSTRVVRRASEAKYTQNKHLKSRLLATYPRTLVKASPDDLVWGIGLEARDCRADDITAWRGENRLGFFLTELRDRLMREDSIPVDHVVGVRPPGVSYPDNMDTTLALVPYSPDPSSPFDSPSPTPVVLATPVAEEEQLESVMDAELGAVGGMTLPKTGSLLKPTVALGFGVKAEGRKELTMTPEMKDKPYSTYMSKAAQIMDQFMMKKSKQAVALIQYSLTPL